VGFIMATGLKKNNASIIDGTSFQDAYDTAAGLLPYSIAQNLTVIRFKDDSGDGAFVLYRGSAAIAATLLAMAQFPKGTIVFDLQAHTTVEKTGVSGTSTWVTSAARA
jgi:hypothetical protein